MGNLIKYHLFIQVHSFQQCIPFQFFLSLFFCIIEYLQTFLFLLQFDPEKEAIHIEVADGLIAVPFSFVYHSLKGGKQWSVNILRDGNELVQRRQTVLPPSIISISLLGNCCADVGLLEEGVGLLGGGLCGGFILLWCGLLFDGVCGWVVV
jgi:hypothetical protein